MKIKVNLGLADMSIAEKVENARHYVAEMTENPGTFPAPLPTLDSVKVAADALEVAYVKALGGGKEQTASKKSLDEALDKLLTQLAAYVEFIADGDESIIPKAGMRVRKQGGSRLSQLRVENTEKEGEIHLSDKFTEDARHIWEFCTDPLPAEPPAPANEQSWKKLKTTKFVDLLIGQLIPGQKYWFRVAQEVNDQQSGWSDPISVIVT
jgi:hypothetical protein